MAQVFGRRSQYLIRMDYVYRTGAVLVYLMFIYLVYSYFKINFTKSASIISLIVATALYVPLVLWIIRDFKKYTKVAGDFFRGRKGEYAVFYELVRNFSDEYCIFQDLKLPGREDNFDFVVLGPSGIYVLEVKSHKGKIEFDGKYLLKNGYHLEKDFLKQVMDNQALLLHNYLKEKTGRDIFINPVVVFSRADVRLGLEKYRGVHVIGKKWLHKLIVEQGEQGFDSETFELLKEELTRLIAVK